MPVSSRSILAPTWPERLSQAGRRVVIANIPLTYPAPAVNGVAIAGGVIPGGATFSHPPEIGPSLGWPINGGSWTTFRGRPLDLVEDVERTSAARAEAMRRLLDSEEWDAACLVFVSPDRIQHCLLEYVHPGHPAPRGGRGLACRRPGARRLPHARPRARHARRAHRRRGHGGAHVRPRAPAVHPGAQHEPRPRASRPPSPRPRLGPRRPARVGPAALDRAGRLRQARPARPRRRADASPSTGRARSPTRASSRPARASRSPSAGASPTGASRRRTTSAFATRWPHRSLEFTDPETGTHPIRAVRRKEEVLDGPYLDRAPDLLLEAGPALLADARPADGRGGGLAERRPPPRGRLRRRRAGGSSGGRLGDLACRLRGDDRGCREPRRRGGRRPAESGPGVFTADEEREVEERLRGLGYLE